MFSNSVLYGGGFGNAGVIPGDNITVGNNLDINALPSKAIPSPNDKVVIGDSEAGLSTKTILISDLQNANSDETFTKIGGEYRGDFIEFIDIPIDIDTYSKLVILCNTLQNDTNNVRVRGVFLDTDKTEITHTFAWSGLSRSQNNTNTQEYNSALNYFPIAGERTTSGLGINNISTHNITIQRQDTNNLYIHTEYQYKDTAGLSIAGSNDSNGIAVLAEPIKYLRLFSTNGFIKGVFYIYGIEKTNFTPQTQSVISPLQSINVLAVSLVEKSIDIPLYPI